MCLTYFDVFKEFFALSAWKAGGIFFSAPLNDFCYMKVFQVNRYGILTHNGAANVVRVAVAYKAAMSCLSIAKVKDT